MKTTMIKISEEIAIKLQGLKESLSETYNDVIARLIKEREVKK